MICYSVRDMLSVAWNDSQGVLIVSHLTSIYTFFSCFFRHRRDVNTSFREEQNTLV